MLQQWNYPLSKQRAISQRKSTIDMCAAPDKTELKKILKILNQCQTSNVCKPVYGKNPNFKLDAQVDFAPTFCISTFDVKFCATFSRLSLKTSVITWVIASACFAVNPSDSNRRT
jgi:hypothetical protein